MRGSNLNFKESRARSRRGLIALREYRQAEVVSCLLVSWFRQSSRKAPWPIRSGPRNTGEISDSTSCRSLWCRRNTGTTIACAPKTHGPMFRRAGRANAGRRMGPCIFGLLKLCLCKRCASGLHRRILRSCCTSDNTRRWRSPVKTEALNSDGRKCTEMRVFAAPAFQFCRRNAEK